MMQLIAQAEVEPDGVNLFPLIVVTLLLLVAAITVYVRRKRKS